MTEGAHSLMRTPN